MARVTVEDCIDKVENRFDLVLVASHRARMIASGQPITIDRDRDKNPVVALREIADGTLQPEDLREDLIHSLQKHVEVDEPEAEVVPALAPAGEQSDASGEKGAGCFHEQRARWERIQATLAKRFPTASSAPPTRRNVTKMPAEYIATPL